MSAARDILTEAHHHGVVIRAEGNSLKLKAKKPPPPDLLDKLRQHKADILAALAEKDGRQSRQEAEEVSFASAVARWLDSHPEPSQPGRCAHCNEVEAGGAVLAPFGAPPHAWVHVDCWEAWFARRQRQAVAALAGLGIKPSHARMTENLKGEGRDHR